MAPLLLLSILPLDLTGPAAQAPAPDGLAIEAALDGDLIAADLVNRGPRPVRVVIGETCGGPTPFDAIVDGGRPRSFASPHSCRANTVEIIQLQPVQLRPGERRRVRSEALRLEGTGRHRLVVRLHGSGFDGSFSGLLTSPPLELPAPGLTVELRARPGAIRGGGELVEVEVIHRWRGASPQRFLTGWRSPCGGPADQLLVDGVEREWAGEHPVCDLPAAPEYQKIGRAHV